MVLEIPLNLGRLAETKPLAYGRVGRKESTSGKGMGSKTEAAGRTASPYRQLLCES